MKDVSDRMHRITFGLVCHSTLCLVIQFEAVWDSHRQPLAPLQGEESPAPELQGPGPASALQDPAHRHIHTPLQGGRLHCIHISINIII